MSEPSQETPQNPQEIGKQAPLQQSIQKVIDLWRTSQKEGKTSKEPGGSGKIMEIEAPGKVARPNFGHGERLYVTFDQPEIIHLEDYRSGGTKIYGEDMSMLVTIDILTGKIFARRTRNTHNPIPSNMGDMDRYPKGHHTTITTYEGNKDVGLTKITTENTYTKKTATYDTSQNNSQATQDNINEETKVLSNWINIFIENWDKDF